VGMEWKSEALTELFEPLVLTPEQYYGERRDDSALLCSIKMLMLAVLEDSIRCLYKHADTKSSAGRRIYEEAER
jgi:hypothetical protein